MEWSTCNSVYYFNDFIEFLPKRILKSLIVIFFFSFCIEKKQDSDTDEYETEDGRQ